MGAVSRLGFLLVAAISIAGCSGSSDDDDDDGGNAACGTVQACGGDVVGVWDVQDVCASGISAMLDEPQCAGAITIGDVSATGRMEFTATGQVITNVNVTMQATYNLTEACVSALAGSPTTLDQAYCNALATGLADSESVTSTGCTLSGRACVCPATFQSTSGSTETYTSNGTSLVDQDGTVMPYCVSGDTLRFSGQTDDAAVSYVLTRAP